MALNADSWLLVEAEHAGREHFDQEHARRYDAKEDAHAAEEVALLTSLGVAGPGCRVVEIGTGTGQFALAAAAVCDQVIAVDVSAVMLEQLREKVATDPPDNLVIEQAGFLTYQHTGVPADAVYSRLALHHLPDFWKALALTRIADILRPGGVLRLWDVVYGFPPQQTNEMIEAAITQYTATDPEDGWTRAELAEHIRDEHSTFTWLLEPMIERAGLDIVGADYSDDQMVARYVCRRR